jgi:hypothetical protein
MVPPSAARRLSAIKLAPPGAHPCSSAAAAPIAESPQPSRSWYHQTSSLMGKKGRPALPSQLYGYDVRPQISAGLGLR